MHDVGERQHRASVDVNVPAHRTQAARKFVSTGEYLGEFNVHPAGHSVALDVRGKLFTMGLWEGAVHQWGTPDGARHRHPQWLADGETVVAVSDETGEERVQTWKGGTTKSLPWDVGRAIAMRAAPSGTLVAVGNHRNEVIVGDVASGEVTVIDKSEHGRTEDVAWSPDGKWLAYTFWTGPRHCAIKLLERCRQERDARHAAGVSRLLAGLRSRRASTCTSCRSARSTRCTTPCSSSSRSRARRVRT